MIPLRTQLISIIHQFRILFESETLNIFVKTKDTNYSACNCRWKTIIFRPENRYLLPAHYSPEFAYDLIERMSLGDRCPAHEFPNSPSRIFLLEQDLKYLFRYGHFDTCFGDELMN